MSLLYINMIFGCHLDITLKKNLMLNRHKHIVEYLKASLILRLTN